MPGLIRFARQQAIALFSLAVALTAVASAATGGNFLLGKSNAANKPTILANSGTGAALDLRPKAGQPALKTNSSKLIPNLNADMVDGKSSSSFAAADSSYTKAQSDANYPATASVYTKAAADARFPYVLDGGTVSGASAHNLDVEILVNGSVTVPGPGFILLLVDGRYTSGAGITIRLFLDNMSKFRLQAAMSSTGTFAETGRYVAAAGTYGVAVTMYSANGSPSKGTVSYTVLYVPLP